jgi:hypothetical protein
MIREAVLPAGSWLDPQGRAVAPQQRGRTREGVHYRAYCTQQPLFATSAADLKVTHLTPDVDAA